MLRITHTLEEKQRKPKAAAGSFILGCLRRQLAGREGSRSKSNDIT